MRNILKVVFGRVLFTVLCLIIQLVWIIALVWKLNQYYVWFATVIEIIGVIVVLRINAKSEFSAARLVWTIVILSLPLFGITLYLMFGRTGLTKRTKAYYEKVAAKYSPELTQEKEILLSLKKENIYIHNQEYYIQSSSGYPVYRNTDVTYYPQTEPALEAMLKDLENAREFIFMEYFIVERGYMWDSILKVLEEKVKEGVEVRVMYDGMCCLMLLPYHYPRVLEKKGIRCKMFSPIKPTLSTYQNNRDHRKIVVIDGHTAFTGGVNLADEYINRKVRFGHWKDTAIMLKGDAVQSFTMMFLQMWNVTERQPEDYGKYAVPKDYEHPQASDHSGFVLPYGDSPMDREQVGERVYLDILNQARSYVHIMTPYLILDDEMVNALSYAAKRGIDVKLIMPHIPDKKYAYMLARTFYPELTRAGVKIYEYTPGFVHAKVFVSDDEKAVVGTINLDFRSLYLHFECAAYIYRNPVVFDVERDFEETLKKCSLITMEDCKNYSWMGKKLGRLMRLIAPLM